MVYINQLSNRNLIPICYNVSHSNILEMSKKQNLTSPQNGLKSSLDQILTAFPVLFGLLELNDGLFNFPVKLFCHSEKPLLSGL